MKSKVNYRNFSDLVPDTTFLKQRIFVRCSMCADFYFICLRDMYKLREDIWDEFRVCLNLLLQPKEHSHGQHIPRFIKRLGKRLLNVLHSSRSSARENLKSPQVSLTSETPSWRTAKDGVGSERGKKPVVYLPITCSGILNNHFITLDFIFPTSKTIQLD